MVINIRDVQYNDIDTILAWSEQLLIVEQSYEPRMTYPMENFRQEFPQRLQNEQILYLIAEFDGKPVGYVYAHIDPSPDYLLGEQMECEIEVIFVESWARGRGLAQDLILRCIKWAQAKNVKRFKTGIFARNNSSLKAFRKCGFEDYHITLVKLL